MVGILRIAALVAAVVFASPHGARAQAPAPDVMLILDASNSMWGRVDGRPKIVVARAAVVDLLRALPRGTRLGLMVYGHRRNADCADIETVVPVGAVDANAMFDSDGYRHHIQHGLDAVRHQFWFCHETGAKGAALHPLAGTAAVQIDLVISPLHSEFGAMSQLSRFAATQLQGDRVLLFVVAQMSLHIAMNQGARRHHFAVQQCPLGEQAMKIAAVAVRPVHHRGDGQLPAVGGNVFRDRHGKDYPRHAISR